MAVAAYALNGSRERVVRDIDDEDPVGESRFLAELGSVVQNYIRIHDQGEDERSAFRSDGERPSGAHLRVSARNAFV